MRRRQILALLGTSLAATAGCTINPGTISIEVRNFASEKAQIHLKLTQDETEQYAKTVILSPDGGTQLENVVDGSEYQLTVSTDKYGKANELVTMNGCDEQEVSVVILESERIDLQIKTC